MLTQLAKITNSRNEYSENLLMPFCTFDKTHTWNIISGGANGIVSNSSVRKFEGSKSLRVDFTGTDELVFSSGSSEMNVTAQKDGIYIFSVRYFKELVFSESDVLITINVFKNSIPFLELEADLYSSSVFDDGKWNNYAQSFQLDEGDVLSFTIKAQCDTTTTNFYIDGLKLELDDRNLGIPSVYSRPIEQITGWQSKTDTINTQILTADIDNLISFAGVDANNGLIGLMDTGAKITPLNLNDNIKVDFVCSFNSPSGTNDFLSVKLKVNGVIYRAQSFNILEPTGETNYVSVSFSLSVMEDFFNFGGEIYINPSVGITIGNRYIQISRNHKGV